MDSRDEILARIQEICKSTFGNPELVISRETTADDIDAWDSLTHVTLVAAVEVAFNTRFSIAEVAALDNIGDLVDLVASHQTR